MADTELTFQEICDFFNKVRKINISIGSIQLALSRLFVDLASVKACSYDTTRVTGTKNSDLLNIVMQIEERTQTQQQKLLEMIKEKLLMGEKALMYIELLTDDKEKSILFDRYLTNATWTTIQKRYHYNEKYCMYLRNQAFFHIINAQNKK